MSGFLIRFFFALVLVLCTFNPSGYSYVDWVKGFVETHERLPLLVFSGVLLVIGWVIYIRATIRSLGFVGVGLASGLFACLIWVLVDMDVLSLQGPVFAWIGLIVFALVLALGMSWSIVRRRISGQYDTDDVN